MLRVLSISHRIYEIPKLLWTNKASSFARRDNCWIYESSEILFRQMPLQKIFALWLFVIGYSSTHRGFRLYNWKVAQSYIIAFSRKKSRKKETVGCLALLAKNNKVISFSFGGQKFSQSELAKWVWFIYNTRFSPVALSKPSNRMRGIGEWWRVTEDRNGRGKGVSSWEAKVREIDVDGRKISWVGGGGYSASTTETGRLRDELIYERKSAGFSTQPSRPLEMIDDTRYFEWPAKCWDHRLRPSSYKTPRFKLYCVINNNRRRSRL